MASALDSGNIMLCSLARDFTLSLTVPLSIQVYKWVTANLTLGLASHQGGSRNTLSRFMLQNKAG